jgi:hypothetical protein
VNLHIKFQPKFPVSFGVVEIFVRSLIPIWDQKLKNINFQFLKPNKLVVPIGARKKLFD